MIIEQIHIDNFGNLQNKTLDLSKALNIIEGANESGKSTIAAFIKFIFYGLSGKSRDKQLCDRDRFLNWMTGSAGGYIVLKAYDSSYRIERTVIMTSQKADGSESKKSYREGCQIINLANNSPISGYSTPGDYFLGVDEELFEKSAFVSQPSGAKIDGNKLLDSIENILFSASENINITKALKKLDASRVALLHKNEAGGQIFELEGACAQLENKLENAKKISTDILNNESSLREAKKNLEIALLKKEKLSREITNFENATVISLFDNYHALETKLARVNENVDSLKAKYTLGGFYPDAEYVSRLEKLSQKLSLMKQELVEKQIELEDLRNKLEKDNNSDDGYDKLLSLSDTLNSLKQKKRTFGILSISFLAIAIIFALCSVGSIVFDILSQLGAVLMVSSSLPLFLFILFTCFNGSAKKKIRMLYGEYGAANEEELTTIRANAEELHLKKKDKESKVTSLEESYKQTLERLGEAERELDSELSWKFSGSFEDNLRSAKEAANEMSRALSEREKLEEMMKMLKTQLKAYDEEKIRASSVALADTSDVDASNIAAKRHEYEFCSKAAEALETRIHELEKTLASLYPQSENPARIAEKIELTKSYIAECRKKHAAYLLAGEKIAEAGESMRDSISPKLAQFTSKIMSELTNGKYSEIGINSDLKVTVRTENGMKELEYLSAGTQDIVYISLRLALISTLFRQTSPTVVFDESFAKLDDTRLYQMLSLLRITSKGMQCILLTSGSRERMLMDVSSGSSYIKL
ncbi:MAG: hypothetical protein E7635_02555 [Ruminococcaceae bacterium]|nr:hypothetical protein [Oscillospiraceae bacterium]